MNPFEELTRRFKDAGVELVFEQVRSCGQRMTAASVFLPDGTGKHRLRLTPSDITPERLTDPFEYYALLPGYEACWCKKFQHVECKLDAGLTAGANWFLRNQLAPLLGADKKTIQDEPEFRYSLPMPFPIEVSIGLCSPVIHRLFPFPRRNDRRDLEPHSILIEKVNVDSDEQARQVLEAIGNAWLFSLDLMIGKPVTLVTRRFRRAGEYRRPSPPERIGPPARTYNPTAMALWSYARRSEGFPLLQFLAFYQVLETFFAECVNREAQTAVRNRLVGRPAFNPDNDADIVDVVLLAQRSGKYLPEEDQMRAVVKEIITDEELRDFLTSNEDRRRYYESKAWRALTDVQVPIRNEDADLREGLAKRLYKIRCRIVHAKDDQRFDPPLYPSAIDVYQLEYDLEAIEMLAERALSTFSKTATWMTLANPPTMEEIARHQAKMMSAPTEAEA